MNLKPIAGIDVSKYFSEMVVISPGNEILARLTIRHNNPSDFDRAIEILKKVEEDFAARPTIVISSHRASILSFFTLTSSRIFDRSENWMGLIIATFQPLEVKKRERILW